MVEFSIPRIPNCCWTRENLEAQCAGCWDSFHRIVLVVHTIPLLTPKCNVGVEQICFVRIVTLGDMWMKCKFCNCKLVNSDLPMLWFVNVNYVNCNWTCGDYDCNWRKTPDSVLRKTINSFIVKTQFIFQSQQVPINSIQFSTHNSQYKHNSNTQLFNQYNSQYPHTKVLKVSSHTNPSFKNPQSFHTHKSFLQKSSKSDTIHLITWSVFKGWYNSKCFFIQWCIQYDESITVQILLQVREEM